MRRGLDQDVLLPSLPGVAGNPALHLLLPQRDEGLPGPPHRASRELGQVCRQPHRSWRATHRSVQHRGRGRAHRHQDQRRHHELPGERVRGDTEGVPGLWPTQAREEAGVERGFWLFGASTVEPPAETHDSSGDEPGHLGDGHHGEGEGHEGLLDQAALHSLPKPRGGQR